MRHLRQHGHRRHAATVAGGAAVRARLGAEGALGPRAHGGAGARHGHVCVPVQRPHACEAGRRRAEAALRRHPLQAAAGRARDQRRRVVRVCMRATGAARPGPCRMPWDAGPPLHQRPPGAGRPVCRRAPGPRLPSRKGRAPAKQRAASHGAPVPIGASRAVRPQAQQPVVRSRRHTRSQRRAMHPSAAHTRWPDRCRRRAVHPDHARQP